ncbi:hypothetical protein BGZ61DRAFT_529174 [Ilyonectria robusta]|uniref:uncharacterized protein n=1 Tax=Ilyonectria robusta TaxID=1079257 RepID=UPI001E8E7971|nr:uncharacterized protein BGZ61DRAFT_529174 [Ilyonectria robusta]KAH8733951.1 hypothetical protein BGZ61DRAFT_529174 [Ilyonectria robusta]
MTDDIDTNPNDGSLPLHHIGKRRDRIWVRLAWAREAIHAGHDVNELDPNPVPEDNLGRPLHAALLHPGNIDEETGIPLEPYGLGSSKNRGPGGDVLSKVFYAEALGRMEETVMKLNAERKGYRNPNTLYTTDRRIGFRATRFYAGWMVSDDLPLHTIGPMPVSTKVRLAWTREAVIKGRDVNRLDPDTNARNHRGRPLHQVLENNGCSQDDLSTFTNEPDGILLVEFYLLCGADPRLKDRFGWRSCLDEARHGIKQNENCHKYWTDALKLMEEAVKKLEEEEEGIVDPNQGPLPLHKIGSLTISIKRRLAWAREALQNEHDVNELGPNRGMDPNRSNTHLGRPLHVALDNPGRLLGVERRTANIYEGLDLIDLYLQHGADPLLEDRFGTTSIDKARRLLNQAQANDEDPGFGR